MAEHLSCEDCGKRFVSAGALRLHRYADHGVTERGSTGQADAIPEPVSPRLANQSPPTASDPTEHRTLPNPRKRLFIGVGVVVLVLVAVVGALWAGGYLDADDRPEPVVLPECDQPDMEKIEQLEQEWSTRTADYNEQRNAALGANDVARVQELDEKRLQEISVYDTAILSLTSCVDAEWDFDS